MDWLQVLLCQWQQSGHTAERQMGPTRTTSGILLTEPDGRQPMKSAGARLLTD